MCIRDRDRMARLVAAIPWIVAQHGASVDEIAERFNYPRELLLADLQDVVFFVGVPPYTPDTLIEITIDDDMVWIDYADWFSRPMRLSGAETLSLLTAGEAALGFDTQDEAGALARGLTKLRLATGSDNVVDVQLGVGTTDVLPTLREAMDTKTCIDIDYYSFGRDEQTQRRIEPSRFFMDAGNWYVGGFCHRADSERVFRVDRIDSVDVTTEPYSRPVNASDEMFAMTNAPRATIRVPAERERLLDGLPVDERAVDGEMIVVTLPVASQRWLTQMMVRLGTSAELVESPDGMAIEIAAAAEEILRRYD